MRGQLLVRHRVVLDVFFERRAPGFKAADVMERFRVFDAELMAKRAPAAENELFDVVSVGLYIIIAEQRKLLAAAGEVGTQTGAVITGGPLCPIGPVGVD